jgi:hypothetical protein
MSAKTLTHLPELGVYGFDRYEPVILAALVTEDPLLLIGRSGTGKTFLLNSLSEALGLAHRHYNASLISFDDRVLPASLHGIPPPGGYRGSSVCDDPEVPRCPSQSPPSPPNWRRPPPPLRAGAAARR